MDRLAEALLTALKLEFKEENFWKKKKKGEEEDKKKSRGEKMQATKRENFQEIMIKNEEKGEDDFTRVRLGVCCCLVEDFTLEKLNKERPQKMVSTNPIKFKFFNFNNKFIFIRSHSCKIIFILISQY